MIRVEMIKAVELIMLGFSVVGVFAMITILILVFRSLFGRPYNGYDPRD